MKYLFSFLTVIFLFPASFGLSATTGHGEEAEQQSDEIDLAPGLDDADDFRLAQADNSPRASERLSRKGTTYFMKKNFGIGLQLGSPTGVTMKYYLDPWNALAFGLGYAYGFSPYWEPYSDFRLDLSYHWHPQTVYVHRKFDLRWYFGGGLRLSWMNIAYDRPGSRKEFKSEFGLAVRAPIGIQFEFVDIPLEAFAEIAPAPYLLPGLWFTIDFAIGARYYFRTN